MYDDPAIRRPFLACRWVALTAMALWVFTASAADARTVTVEAMLIHASDRPAALDARMDRVEYRLRRIFAFEHYGFMSETRAILTLPAQTELDIGHGYTLRIDAVSRDGRIRADIRWRRGERTLLSTAVAQRLGVPAILGGPPHEGGALILVLEFK